MRINLLLFIGSLLFANIVHGQSYVPGFIVTQEYDSIDGWVQKMGDRSSEQICLFKKTPASKVEKYNPEQLVSYGFQNGRVYVSNQLGIEINRLEPSFVRVIVDGIVPLYYFKGKYAYRAPSKRLYLLLKEDNFYRSNLSAILVNECYDLTSEIENLSLSDKSLANFFLRYHSCVNQAAKAFLDKKEHNSLDISLGGGISKFKVNAENEGLEDFVNAPPSTSSILLRARFNKGSRGRLNLISSISVLYHSDYLIDYTDENYSSETRFDYNSLRLGIGARYRFAHLNEKIAFDLLISGGVGLSALKDERRIVDQIDGNNIFIRSQNFEIESIEPFVSASLVVSYLSGSKTYFAELNNSVAFGQLIVDTSTSSNYTLNSASLLIGIKIPLK